jgi:GNAT superfamily N-acetyltransferase
MAIEMSFGNRRYWWHTNEVHRSPQYWNVSADIWHTDICPLEYRHVADLALASADPRDERRLLDAITLSEPTLAFLREAATGGRAELDSPHDQGPNPAPPMVLVLRHIELMPAWRGLGLGAGLISGVLSTFRPVARMAVCSVSPIDLDHYYRHDRLEAVEAAFRVTAMLERAGFRERNGVHVVDLRDQALADARQAVFDRWEQSGRT